MKNLSTLAIVLAALSFSQSASAQVVVPRTPVTAPSQVEQHLRIEEERPQVGGESVITVPDQKGHQKILERGGSFVLRDVVFENLTVFNKADLRSEYADYLGKTVSLATLNDIASRITARYRNAGYILSRAVVPPQRIQTGTVRIRIIEGYVDKVQINGIPNNNDLVAKYADKIRDVKPLNAATLERYLLLMNDLPGVSAQAVIRPSASIVGASDLVVNITQKKIDGALTLDNRGTRYLGPVQGGLVVGANNMLGLYDRTQFHGVLTANANELQYGEVVHEEPIGTEGTKIAVSAARTHTNPDYKLSAFNVQGQDTLLSAAVSHPFLRSRESNIYGNARFDYRQTDTSALAVPLYQDKLRVLRAGGSYDFIDRFLAVNRVEGNLSKGFGWDVGSSAGSRSRAAGQPDFIKATAQASRLQPISGPVNFYFIAAGQASAEALLVAEQFSLGGPTFGSAYDPSELTGDSGLAGRAELQYDRTSDIRYLQTYQLYGFYDVGAVWNRNVQPGEQSRDSLASTGVGVRFNVAQPLSGDLELAVPLTKYVAANGEDGHGARVFFSLAYRY